MTDPKYDRAIDYTAGTGLFTFSTVADLTNLFNLIIAVLSLLFLCWRFYRDVSETRKRKK